MGTAARASVWLWGAVLGAGACYCAYRLARHERGRGFSGRPVRPGNANIPKSPGSLEAQDLQKLIRLLEAEDPLVREKALITLGNSAAFSANQEIIRDFGGLPAIGNLLDDPTPKVKEKALDALNNLSMNLRNQEEIKVFVGKVCEETLSSPLNSALQLAGLRLLTNMSVTNDYQHLVSDSISDFLHLLSAGNENTQVQVLKVLVNLSANPAMTKELLSAQAPPSLISLFNGSVAREVLLRVVRLVANLNDHVGREEVVTARRRPLSEDSLFALLYGETGLGAQKLTALTHHPDPEVREQIARITAVGM
ncbi:armadillo repeat-containing protein 10 [Tachyglossus aculeatus]|uniref:armadillo repeat-containing protein 10 n=1 Tax=Tachyglossus aculeatus TaxID=9261 RepID=UPI0018F659C1|nr:armadillo repeat-containing protein 10 [Tachyglossus aculeatus]